MRVSYCYRHTDLLSLHCLVLGIRLFDEGIKSTDATESVALVHKLESIDIYSNSWGPGDMGWRVEGPGPLTRKALELGSKKVLYQIIRTLSYNDPIPFTPNLRCSVISYLLLSLYLLKPSTPLVSLSTLSALKFSAVSSHCHYLHPSKDQHKNN